MISRILLNTVFSFFLGMPALFEGAQKNWKFVLGFVVFSVLFWLLELGFQLFALHTPLKLALVRSFSLAGTTFFGLALFSSAIFRWFPKSAKYWTIRRSLGVMGTVFIVFHVLTALNFVFNGDLQQTYFSLNPIENPVVFGSIAFPIFFVMALTSTDWAVQKLKTKWKAIHRLVYFGFWATVFHFLLINPPALMNLMGYLLMAVTFLALTGELYWFIQTTRQRKAFSLGTAIGILVIFLYLITAYLAWFAR